VTKAHFHLSGFVNKQNLLYWTEINPKYFMNEHLTANEYQGVLWQTLVL